MILGAVGSGSLWFHTSGANPRQLCKPIMLLLVTVMLFTADRTRWNRPSGREFGGQHLNIVLIIWVIDKKVCRGHKFVSRAFDMDYTSWHDSTSICEHSICLILIERSPRHIQFIQDFHASISCPLQIKSDLEFWQKMRPSRQQWLKVGEKKCTGCPNSNGHRSDTC